MTTEAWRGDDFCRRVSPPDGVVELEELNGWVWHGDEPTPRGRRVWVITEYLRRCIVRRGVFVKWSIVDEKGLFWHRGEVGGECDPPDWPVGLVRRAA